MLQVLDATAVRRWAGAGTEALDAARQEIDGLNVYPVPDGDTGTNLFLTVQAACAGLDEVPPRADLTTVTSALAASALLGARGNSGIILSQMFRGLATSFAGATSVDGPLLAAGLRRAADLAYAAVAQPVEGTMLTVAEAAAEGAERAGGELSAVAEAAGAAARSALLDTTDQLDVLRAAGVVDAGGVGLCVLLDTLVGVVTGVVPAAPAALQRPRALAGALGDIGGPAYEVMFLWDAAEDALVGLRSGLEPLGDSLVIVGGDGLWHVHVHVDDVGAALEAAVGGGRPHRIRVRHIAADAARGGELSERRGIVAVVAGDGLAALLETAGATVVHRTPGRAPSAGDVLEGIRAAGSPEVVLLPAATEGTAAAEEAAAHARALGIRVAVLPIRATVQALAAAAVHDPARSFDEDVVAMTTAAAQTRHGALTVSAAAAMTMAGQCAPGDVLGMIAGDYAVIGDDLEAVAYEVVDRMLAAGGELVTLVTGADAPRGLSEAVRSHLRRRHPEVDAVVHLGGQPGFPLLVGVE